MKMEPIVSSETSAIKSQTPGNYPKRNKLHLQHGESLKKKYLSTLHYLCGPGSSVGIATDYGLNNPGSNPGGDDIFCPSRPALGPTQPPVRWVPGLSRGKERSGRAVDHSPLLVSRPWKSRATLLPTLWATPGL